ncbi:hypothetical protein E2562_022643 [Oryza meyeriana var. granulata]|uniref:Uncharacterized protein n=1 Tax=Oryza meyeriana var. granulata TaxID=110450 RepID=A0A6G1CRC3_9ORYZ|nr:hypothetical protein E2562_022643 [Oryza meyeriana var. granulata]
MLGTLVVDFVGTHFYEWKHHEEAEAGVAAATTATKEAAALLEDGNEVLHGLRRCHSTDDLLIGLPSPAVAVEESGGRERR